MYQKNIIMEPLSPSFFLDSCLKFQPKDSIHNILKNSNQMPLFIDNSQNFEHQKQASISGMNQMLLDSYQFVRESQKLEAIKRYNNILKQDFQVGSVISESQEQFQRIYQQSQSLQGLSNSRSNLNYSAINFFQRAPKKYAYEDYFSEDLAHFLSERSIPINYVRGLLMIKDIKELKTKRQLKVQRYLKKRQKKTWNKKICYDCRQRVAGQRLRIKGKFIKKRTAMKILHINQPITLPQLRERLIKALKGKTLKQIEQIIENSQNQKFSWQKTVKKNQQKIF